MLTCVRVALHLSVVCVGSQHHDANQGLHMLMCVHVALHLFVVCVCCVVLCARGFSQAFSCRRGILKRDG